MGASLAGCCDGANADGYESLSSAARPAASAMNRAGGGDDAAGLPFGSARFEEYFDLREQLGKGSTAACHLCVELGTGQRYAVKVINKKKISVLYADLLPQFRREVDILRRLQHPNIIRLHRVFESKTVLHVVTELASGGELFEYLVGRPNSILTEATVSFLIRQCFSAAAHMHAHGIIHRDIKLENILLASKPSEDDDDDDEDADGARAHDKITLKIIDFGLAFTQHQETVPAPSQQAEQQSHGRQQPLRTAKTFFGTVGYIAPEMLKRKTYTEAVDVWALGVVTYVLLCGVFPFEEQQGGGGGGGGGGKKRFQPNDYKLRYPAWVHSLSESARDLLQWVLTVDSGKRPTAEEVLKHPWVSGETASPRQQLQSPGHLAKLRNPAAALKAMDSLAEEGNVSPLLLDEGVVGDDALYDDDHLALPPTTATTTGATVYS